MPIIKSAKKRVRQTRKASVRNTRTRRNLRAALKNLQVALDNKDSKKLTEAQRAAQSALDTAVKKGLMHKNKAARQKARISAQSKASGAKVTKSAPKTPAKKPAAKKPSSTKSGA